MHYECALMSHLLLTAQRHASVSSESQEFLLNLRNLTGTRRGSTSFIEILQRRAHWHTHSKPQPVCSCPKPQQSQREPVKQSFTTSELKESPLLKNTLTGNILTEAELLPHGPNPHNFFNQSLPPDTHQ